MDLNYDKLAVNDSGCLNEIKENLDLTCNHKTGKLIGRVLHAIRDSLDYSMSAELISLLPDNIKIIYVSDWKLKTVPFNLKHLDDLIKAVVENDDQHTDQVFKGHSESFILNAIITVIKALDNSTGILSRDFLNYSLKKELAEAMTEAA